MNKPLQVNSSASLELGWEIIKYLIKINNDYKSKVDFQKQNKTHALYLVLGGLTTFSTRALYSIKHGYAEDLGQLQRFIAESMDLALFFLESSADESRQITQWFNGVIVKRQPGNKGNLLNKERASLFNTDERTIEQIDQAVKTANKVLSQYLHPSYNLVTVTYDKATNDFSYYGKRSTKFSKEELSALVNLSVYPAITAFGMGMDFMFPINIAEDLKKGMQYMKTLAGFTRKLYPESFV